MVMINLLPWRSHVRQYERKRYYLITAGSAGLSTLIVLLIYVFKMLQMQTVENSLLEHRERLQAIVRVNEMMRETYKTPAASDDHLMLSSYIAATNQLIELVRQLSGINICFQKVSRRQGRVILIGSAVSAQDVFSLVRQWSGNELFSNVKLVALQTRSHHVVQFQIQAIEKTSNRASLTKRKESVVDV